MKHYVTNDVFTDCRIVKGNIQYRGCKNVCLTIYLFYLDPGFALKQLDESHPECLPRASLFQTLVNSLLATW